MKKLHLPKIQHTNRFGPPPFSTPETLSHDWKITLIVFAFILVAAIAAGLYLLYEARTPGAVSTTNTSSEKLPFSKVELEKIQQDRANEQSAFEILRTTPPTVADPSL